MRLILISAPNLLLLAACAPVPPAGPQQQAAVASSETRGLAFAQERCAGCHAVTAPGVSPNPEAPPFDAVVAAPGLTAQTLSAYLRDSHNFPGAMDFPIDPDEIEALTSYMLTLRSKG